MKKSGDEVLNDLYPPVNASGLIAMLSGKLYKDGTMRPLNSTEEDAILSFKAGLDGQIQEGAVTLNIYVPDIDNGSGGKTKNSARTAAISQKANEEFGEGKHVGNYWFRLGNIVQTYKAEIPNQHFVSVDLRFRLRTF